MNEKSTGIRGSFPSSDILAQISDPVIAIDFDDTVLFWNKAAENLYGRSSTAVIGKPLSTAFRRKWVLSENENTVLESIRKVGSAMGERSSFKCRHTS